MKKSDLTKSKNKTPKRQKKMQKPKNVEMKIDPNSYPMVFAIISDGTNWAKNMQKYTEFVGLSEDSINKKNGVSRSDLYKRILP